MKMDMDAEMERIERETLAEIDALVERAQADTEPGCVCVHDQLARTCRECKHELFRAGATGTILWWRTQTRQAERTIEAIRAEQRRPWWRRLFRAAKTTEFPEPSAPVKARDRTDAVRGSGVSRTNQGE